ncbi:hypothetical protein ACFWNL_03490 [Kitasatospora sp. NPDC058397]|uniref:hypothetical protein n=1 Tax=unclassified Kitasatospora TaxID=2633591 RepID=UPI003660E7D6
MKQDTYHCVLTLQQTVPGATAIGTFANIITPSPGMTRADIFEKAIATLTRHQPELTGGAVLFFSLDKNQV